MRHRLLDAMTRLDPARLARHPTGELALWATRGTAAVRAVPDPLRAFAGPGLRPSGRHGDRDLLVRLDQRTDRALHAAADTGVRRAHRGVGAGAGRPPVAAAVRTLRALPGRRPGAPDPGRLPPSGRAGGHDPRGDRPLPQGHRRDAAAGLRVCGGAGAGRDPVGRAGRRLRGPPAGRRFDGLPRRDDRAAARPGGVLAAAPRRRRVPCRRRGDGELRRGRPIPQPGSRHRAAGYARIWPGRSSWTGSRWRTATASFSSRCPRGSTTG